MNPVWPNELCLTLIVWCFSALYKCAVVFYIILNKYFDFCVFLLFCVPIWDTCKHFLPSEVVGKTTFIISLSAHNVDLCTYRSSVAGDSTIVPSPLVPSQAPPTSPAYPSDHHSLFNSRTLAYQKTYRARRLGSRGTRYYLLWGLSLFSLFLAWAIGRSDAHPAVLVLLVVAMVILWWDQGGRILEAIEKQTEMRVRRRKTVQHSESAEWVNLAINRW